MKLIRGNFIEAKELGKLTVTPRGCAVVDGETLVGLYAGVPEQYAGAPVEDWGDALVLQGFCDLHLHAPQYPMLGLGMDLPLLDWLNAYAFPTEASFSDTVYARRVYGQLAKALIDSGTTRVCMFSSLHTDATLILMEELEKAGVSGYVGKVNMDRNTGDLLTETTQLSKSETLRWLDGCDRFHKLRPILTPRFTPACSNELMAWLGALKRERNLRVQSHLSENLREMEWVQELHPDCAQYWETYDRYGLFSENTVMAHCVHSDAREQEALRDHGVLVAHSPDSNINLCSGHAPIREMLERGVWVALASDIAGGAELPMLRVMTACLRTSKAKRIESDWETPFLTVAEAYYLATSSGARFFGSRPGFAPGDPFHAVVIDDGRFPPALGLDTKRRFERAVYLAGADEIVAVYADGKRVK